MSPQLQSLLALAIVAIAAALLVHGAFKKRKSPGCGGCPTDKFKAKLKG